MSWTDYVPGKRVVSLVDFASSGVSQDIAEVAAQPQPKKGEIVTIADTIMIPDGNGEDVLCLMLVEYDWPTWQQDCGKCGGVHVRAFAWPASLFKPLDESRIDQFRQMLSPADAPEVVAA